MAEGRSPTQLQPQLQQAAPKRRKLSKELWPSTVVQLAVSAYALFASI
jgi:negative regulator of sigma E activity